MSETPEDTNARYDGWPARPTNEVFPPILDTLGAAMLLGHDLRGRTPDQGRRNVRNLIRFNGLPARKSGNDYMLCRDAVLEWARGGMQGLESEPADANVSTA